MVVGVTRKEALKRARKLEMSDIIGDLPSITPTDAELKESGTYHRARIELMRNKANVAQLQQEKYLNQVASELNLKVIPIRGLATLKRATGFEWTNGWTKHGAKAKPKSKPKPKPTPVVSIKRIVIGKKTVNKNLPSLATLKNIESLVHLEKLSDKQLTKRYKQLQTTKRAWIGGRLPNTFYRGVADPGGVTGKVPKDVYAFTNLDPTMRDFEKEMQGRAKPKKRQRLHTSRTGKTPRVLRKAVKNGHRVFSFSDDIWKVRKRKRRKR